MGDMGKAMDRFARNVTACQVITGCHYFNLTMVPLSAAPAMMAPDPH